ncbi:MAG: hypothetical protein JSR59_23095 [Proteobacteria bacterium]|nr:hypothetical protein [Pseudomonadota bacterium]
MRQPLHARAGGRLPGFDDRALGAVEPDALAGFDQMVIEIARTRQPDAAFGDPEFPAREQVHELPGGHGETFSNLRVHHESPEVTLL